MNLKGSILLKVRNPYYLPQKVVYIVELLIWWYDENRKWGNCRCNEFWIGWKVDPGVEYWTLDQFSTLKIETLGCGIYTWISFLQIFFSLGTNYIRTLKSKPFEYWPLVIELWSAFDLGTTCICTDLVVDGS